MVTPHSTKRTSHATERLVITNIAMGMKYQEIEEEFGVPVSTIKKIKRRNGSMLFEVRQRIIEKESDIAARLAIKANRLLEQRLDRALAGDEVVSTKDLVSIVKELPKQIKPEPEDRPPGEKELSPQQAEELRIAVESDDYATMTKILFAQKGIHTHS